MNNDNKNSVKVGLWFALILSVLIFASFVSIAYVSGYMDILLGGYKFPPPTVDYDYFGLISGLLAVIVAILAIVITLVPLVFYAINMSGIRLEIEKSEEHLKEKITQEIISNIKVEIEKIAKDTINEVLDKHTAEQDRSRYFTDMILFKLWAKRMEGFDDIQENDEKIDFFIQQQLGHLKDASTLTQLRLPKARLILNALGTLEHHEHLPSNEFSKLICLLKKQGRLEDENVRQVAEGILARYNTDLDDC